MPLARASIARAFGIEHAVDRDAEWLRQPGACFVTLMQYDELRGCIGSLEPRRPLLIDVEANACAAAFSDPRFTPLSRVEFNAIDIEISLLSPLQLMQFGNESDALAQLQPGIDGVLFECGPYRSTFLPQVWEQLATPREFLAHLKAKAGLPTTFWAAEVRLHRYTVTKYKEAELDLAATG